MQFLDKQDVDSLPVAMELCVAMKLTSTSHAY